MGEQKKSAKAGRAAKSKSNERYKFEGRRYRNKIMKVKRHIKRCGDPAAAAWLKEASKIYAPDYKRRSEAVRKAHEAVYRR